MAKKDNNIQEKKQNVIQKHVEASKKHNGLKVLLLHQAVDLDLIYGAELTEEDLPYNDFDYIFIPNKIF